MKRKLDDEIIDRLRKEIEWKDMVIELAQRTAREAQEHAAEVLALNRETLKALQDAQEEIRRLRAKMEGRT